MNDMVFNELLQNVKWDNSPEGFTALSFDVVIGDKRHTVSIKSSNAARQLQELKKGRRVRAAFSDEKSEVEIWREPRNRYRIECRNEGAIDLDVTINEKEMDILFSFHDVSG